VQRTVHMHGRQTTRTCPAMLDLVVIDYHYLTLPVCDCMVYLKGMKSSEACWSWNRRPAHGCGDPVEVDRSKDRVRKRNIYEREQVPHYLDSMRR